MTAGNSTPLSDGASTVLLASEEWAAQHGPRRAGVLRHRPDRGRRPRPQARGAADGPRLRGAALLERTGLSLQDFDFYEIHEAFAAQVLCTLKAWEDPVFCRERLGLDAAARRDRPRQAQRPRRLARRRAPVRGHRRADRGQPGQAAARAGLGPRTDLDLRRRRTRRHRDHGGRSMSDRYQQLINTPIGKLVSKQVGLPEPGRARALRARAAGDRRAGAARRRARRAPRARRSRRCSPPSAPRSHTPMTDELRTAAADAGLDAKVFNPEAATDADSVQGARVRRHRDRPTPRLCTRPGRSSHPTIRRVRANGRVIVLGTPPQECTSPAEHIAQRALEGLSRAIGKEVRRGATAPARLRRPGRRGVDRVDAALLALAALGLRVGSGDPDRGRAGPADRRRLGAPADRPRGAGHRRLARDRRGDRRGARPRRRPRGRRRRAGHGGRAAGGHRAHRRLGAHPRHHRGGLARRRSPPTSRRITKASTWSSTTPASPVTRRSDV